MKKTYGDIGKEVKPPIEEIDFDKKTLELEIRSYYGGFVSRITREERSSAITNPHTHTDKNT